MPKLVISDGEATHEHALKSGDTIGRTSQNAIPLKVAEASRQHCRFTEEKNAWFVEDLGSSNGTLVNGRRVTKFELQDGDAITIGKVECKFLDAEVEAGPSLSSANWGEDDISLEEKVFFILGGANRAGELLEIPEGGLTVGRNARHSLILKDASVSGDHAQVTRNGNSCSVKDLGSSNGTFINGRRVEQSALASNDIVRFGTIECRFGVGDPKEFEAPVAKAAATPDSNDQFTRSMNVQDLGEDEGTFEMHVAAPQRETVWNIVALVLILALGGGAAFVFLQTKDSGGSAARAGTLDRGSNLLPEWVWSFELPESDGTTELPEVPAWTKAEGDDGSELGEVPDPAHTGHLAYRVHRGSSSKGLALAVLDARVTVTAGSAYRVAVMASGGGAIPVVGVNWMEEPKDAEEPVANGRDLIYGLASSKAWRRTEGIVFAPEGSSFLNVCVGSASAGSVVLDDVVVERIDAPSGRAHEVSGFRATVGPHGTLSISRYGRRLIDGLGVFVKEGDVTRTQDALLAVDEGSDSGAISGNLAGGKGALSAALQGDAEKFSFVLKGDALSMATGLAIPVVPRGGVDVQITVLDGESAKSFAQTFDAHPATALIVGAGQDRAKIHFRDASGATVRGSATAEIRNGGATVMIAAAGRTDLVLDFQVSFVKEEAEARALMAKATQAVREKRGGDAIRACAEIDARFPFEAKVMEDATRLRDQVTADGRKSLEALKARLDDASFFRELLREAKLGREIADEQARFAGTTIGDDLAKLRESFDSQVAAFEQPRREAVLGRVLARGKDYMDGGKGALAALFFGAVTSAYPGTEEAAQAAAFLQRVKQAGKER